MATLLLPVAFNAVASGIAGGAAGFALFGSAAAATAGQVLAGGLIDQLLLMPALFPPPEQHGPRLNDLQLQTTKEGAARNRAYGQGVRVPCHLVWQTLPRETYESNPAGGKGGTGGNYIKYRYHFDFAVELCRGPINRVIEVWADGKTFWKAEPDIAYSSDQIAATVENDELKLTSDMAGGGPDLSQLINGLITIGGFTGDAPPFTDGETINVRNPGQNTLIMRSTTGGTLNVDDTLEIEGHETIYRVPTQTVLSAGISKAVPIEPDIQSRIGTTLLAVTVRRGDSVNNGTWEAHSPDIDEPLSESTVLITHPAANQITFPWKPVDEGVDTVTIDQVQPTFSKSQAADVRFQLGDDDQEADELMIEFESVAAGGDGNVYAGIGRARMIVEDFDGADHLNRLPNFEAMVEVTPDDGTLASIIKAVCLDHGLTENQIDVSGVTGTIGGYNVRGPQSGKVALAPLLLVGNVVAREEGGQLVFVDRTSLTTTTVDAADMAAHEPGQEMPGLLDVDDRDESEMPSQVEVSYIDQDNEYQTGMKRSPTAPGVPTNVKSVDLPLVLTGDQAQQLANAYMAIAWGTRRRLVARLGPSKLGTVKEGTLLDMTNVYGDTWKMLVSRLDRGANNILVVSGREEDDDLYTQTATGEGPL